MDMSDAVAEIPRVGPQEEWFAPLLTEHLRAKRRGTAGRSWYVDGTYINVHGRWCYLYRAIDRDGHLVESLLSETREAQTARRFFRRARAVVGRGPRFGPRDHRRT